MYVMMTAISFFQYAHRKCVQHWCNEKGDITCEICHQPYQPDYTAPPHPPHSEDTAIDIGGGWTISGTQLDLRDPRLLAIAEAERHFLESEYDDYATSNASGAAFCRSVALILMALLLLRHALTLTDSDADDDVSTFFSVSGIAFPASGSWFSSALLHHGLGHQHLAASEAKTGGSSIGCDTGCFCAPIRATEGSAVYHCTRTYCNSSPGTCLILQKKVVVRK
ncbi:hypothetical protein NC652_020879 [Populus alba x Populus x berolinensis]|nr:hypothetical protein NC652_020879 [Populus alba x Populus x berolinensis]